jgi:lysosomal acid lipase/cholesteryl ester hydrolase
MIVIDYDVPAFVSYAIEHSQVSSVSYIGHSQGTLIGFGALASNRKLDHKINLFVALAPVAFVGNMRYFSFHSHISEMLFL